MKLDRDLKIVYGVWFFIVVSSILFLPLISSSPGLIDDVVSYYKCDDNLATTNVIDVHGVNNGTASANTNTISVAGKINTALDGAGTHYVDIPAFDPTGSSGELLSVSLWTDASPQGGAGEQPLISQYDYTNNKRAWRITDYSGDGRIRVYLTDDGTATNIKDYYTTAVVLDGSYKHIGFTWNNGTLTIYVNGSAVAVTKARDDAFAALTDLTSDVNLGRYAGAVVYKWNGGIDEVAIFSADIGSDGMSDLYNSNDGLAYPFAVDTCTCAGAGNNWEIAMSDYCNITEACDLTTGTLSFTGSGWCNCNASVDTTNLGDPGANGILYIQDSCLITID